MVNRTKKEKSSSTGRNVGDDIVNENICKGCEQEGDDGDLL